MKIRIIIYIIVALIVMMVSFTWPYNCDWHLKKKEKLPGIKLSEKEKKDFSVPMALMIALFDNVKPQGDGVDDDGYRIPEKARPEIVLRGIAAYERLDGYQLKGHRTFYRESTYLLYLYLFLIQEYDALGDCEEVSKVYKKVAELSEYEYLIVAYSYPPPESLVYPGDEGYEKLRKEQTESKLASRIRHSRNCKLFDGQEDWLKEYDKKREKPNG